MSDAEERLKVETGRLEALRSQQKLIMERARKGSSKKVTVAKKVTVE